MRFDSRVGTSSITLPLRSFTVSRIKPPSCSDGVSVKSPFGVTCDAFGSVFALQASRTSSETVVLLARHPRPLLDFGIRSTPLGVVIAVGVLVLPAAVHDKQLHVLVHVVAIAAAADQERQCLDA